MIVDIVLPFGRNTEGVSQDTLKWVAKNYPEAQKGKVIVVYGSGDSVPASLADVAIGPQDHWPDLTNDTIIVMNGGTTAIQWRLSSRFWMAPELGTAYFWESYGVPKGKFVIALDVQRDHVAILGNW